MAESINNSSTLYYDMMCVTYVIRDGFGIAIVSSAAHCPAPGSSRGGTDTFGSRFATAYHRGGERALNVGVRATNDNAAVAVKLPRFPTNHPLPPPNPQNGLLACNLLPAERSYITNSGRKRITT